MSAPAPPRPTLPPQGADAREAFLVLPGLNLHPHRLEPCTALLAQAGAATIAPRLAGFAAPGDPALGRVHAERWLSDVETTWAAVRAQLPHAQPSLLGFSLGGLLGLLWAVERGVPLRRAVLLSPALRLRGRYRALLRGLGPLLPGRLRLPSRSPSTYRFHPATSVAAYRTLARLERRLQPHLQRWLHGEAAGLPPLLLAYAPQDELVATRPFTALARAHPGRVTLVPLTHRPQPGFPAHLGLDAHTLGEAEWQRFAATLGDWLRRTAPAAAADAAAEDAPGAPSAGAQAVPGGPAPATPPDAP